MSAKIVIYRVAVMKDPLPCARGHDSASGCRLEALIRICERRMVPFGVS